MERVYLGAIEPLADKGLSELLHVVGGIGRGQGHAGGQLGHRRCVDVRILHADGTHLVLAVAVTV